jgi:glycosyltransferase involved in cell wall biosynthesis
VVSHPDSKIDSMLAPMFSLSFCEKKGFARGTFLSNKNVVDFRLIKQSRRGRLALRFLFAMDTFPYYGTSESLLFALKLQELGHDVLVCTSSRTTDGHLNRPPAADVGIRYFPSVKAPRLPYVITPTSFPQTLTTIREYKPDIVIAMHYVHFTTNMAVLASFLLKVPVILGIRGPGTAFGIATINALKKNLSRTIGRVTISLSDLVIFDCYASRRAYSDVISDERSAVVYSPVDTSRFVPRDKTDGPLTVTYLGSLTPTKGLQYLMQALPVFLSKFPDARIWIAGDGILRRKLENIAPRNVSFLGYRTDVGEILRQSDMVVLPSVSEGVSNSLLEAGACGRACIASDVGGSPEIIDDGVNGLLFPSMDSSALGKAMITLCGDPEMRKEFGIRLREKVKERFDINPVAKKLEQTATMVVARGPKSLS